MLEPQSVKFGNQKLCPMRKNRLFLPALALSAAAATLAFIPAGSAQADTNGLGIHTVTKNLVQGDTSRVKGKVVGARGKVTVTIQQRSPGRGEDWGSGRKVTTDSNGKFVYDRKIKGKYTRDYRVCTGPAGRRKCSLRARIEVVPRVYGLYMQQIPANVDAGQTMTVRGSSDSSLANRVVALQQYNPDTLLWTTIGSGTVAPNFTFEVTGTPTIPGKAETFRMLTSPFSGRSQATISYPFASNVYGFYSATTYPPIQGGTKAGPTVFQRDATTAAVTYASALAPSDGANTFTLNLAGACNRFTADVFLSTTAAAGSTRTTSVVTAVGANEMTRFGPATITRGDAVQKVDVPTTDAQTLRITQGPNGDGTTSVWYANPTLSCAF